MAMDGDALQYEWRFWARPEQLPPPGAWVYWLIDAGRGFGKTRTGAETVREWARRFRFINLIGATIDDARDIIVMQVTVASLDAAAELTDNLLQAGYPVVGTITADPGDGSEALWPKRFHASADPGRPTHIHIRADGAPNQRFALLFVDWLTANASVRADYLAVKRGGDAAAVARWFSEAHSRAAAWAQATNWTPRPLS